MWLLVFFEYFKISSNRSLVINFVLSALILLGVFCLPNSLIFDKLIEQFVNNSVSVLSLLVGFTVAMFTLLISISNPNIEEIKTITTTYKLYGEAVTIFKMLLIRTVYIILVESILLLFNLFYPFFFKIGSCSGKIFFGLDTFLLTHIIIANINNTVDLYFILTKKEN